MNVKQREARTSRIIQQYLELRGELWPNLDPNVLWEPGQGPGKKQGFVAIPRTMPIILRILDDLAPKGQPISGTYMALWCRDMGTHLIQITEPRPLAYEAGFGGSRSESTWRTRMKTLCDLEFIEAKPGSTGPFSYVLLYNPYHVIRKLNTQRKIQEQDFIALLKRAQEIGADVDLK